MPKQLTVRQASTYSKLLLRATCIFGVHNVAPYSAHHQVHVYVVLYAHPTMSKCCDTLASVKLLHLCCVLCTEYVIEDRQDRLTDVRSMNDRNATTLFLTEMFRGTYMYIHVYTLRLS